MQTDTTTFVSFLLDETGSMEDIKDDTIGGFNQYLASLRQPESGQVEFTLVKFDSNRIDKVYVGTPINDVQPLTKDTYKPGAATPLIDAAVKILRATDEALQKRTDSPRVLVVIQTDGHENASREYSLAHLQDLIKEKTALGWQFVFLGAGIDAFSQASSWGISASNALSYRRGNSQATFHALSVNTTVFRSSGAAAHLTFSPQQRQTVGDEHHAQPLLPTQAPVSITQPQGAQVPAKPGPIVDDFTFEEDVAP